MSFDQVLLIAFLVVLPLIQHVVKHLRRQRELREQAEGRPPSVRLPQTGYEEPLPPPPGRSDAAAPRTAPAGAPMAAPAKSPDLAVAPGGRPGIPSGRPNHPIDLRRAVVLMTLIGPCRAASPHDS